MIYLILIFGFLVRLVSLNQSLWLDEGTTAMVSKMSVVDIFTKFLPGDFHPPLYYLIMKFWTDVFGYSEIALRFPSIIFGVVTIYLVYKISRSNLAAILTASSGLLIYYSQEARMYMFVAMLVTWSIYLYKEQKWLWLSIVLAMIGMTDYVALLILPIFGYLKIKIYLPLIISYFLWTPLFLKQLIIGMAVEGSSWWNILGTPSIKNILLIPVKFIIGRISFDNKFLYGLLIASILTLVGYIFVRALGKSKLYVYWLFVPILLGVLVSFKVPVLTYFRFIFCLPAMYILISQTRASKILVSMILIINFVSSSYYLFNTRFHREDWRRLAMEIGNNKIIFPQNSQKEALAYYNKEKNIINYKQVTPEDNEVWLSRYVWEIFDPNDTARLQLIALGYNKTLEKNFNGVLIYKYQK